MEIVLLGTGGAFRYPSLWCGCQACERARYLAGRNLRSSSCLLIKPDLLIDFPPEIGLLSERYGLRLSQIKHVLFTHSHNDHFYPQYFRWHSRRKRRTADDIEDSACLTPLDQLNIYGSPYVCDRVRFTLSNTEEIEYQIVLHPISVWKSFEINSLEITPIPANHHVSQDIAMNYVIHDGSRGAVLLYLLDSGPPFDETLSFLRRFRFDAVIVDVAGGTLPDSRTPPGHMNIGMARKIFSSFRATGLLKKEGIFILSHFTHSAPVYDDLVKNYERDNDNFKIGYDGMRLSLGE